MAAGKLRDLGFAREVEPGDVARGQPLAQPRDEARPIELLAGTHLFSVSLLIPRTRHLFSTGAGAPPPAHAIADTSPRIHSPRLSVAAGAFPLALGPHPQRTRSLTPRLGFTVLGSMWPQALA